MKKVFAFIFMLFLVTGCACTANLTKDTPTKKVETFFNHYQTLHTDVMTQLEDVISKETTFTEEHKTQYKDIMKKHYQDLTYEIKDEVVDGDNATVTAEIEVRDYSKVMQESETYRTEHPEEFNDTTGAYDINLFNAYRLEKLKAAQDKVKYTLNLTLTKIDDEWRLDDLSDIDESKIHGTYQH